MERIQPQTKLNTWEFVFSANEVPKTIGPPSYTGMVQPVREAIITNLIGIVDRRDPMWGTLWMILNTANAALFPGGPPAQIQPTAHPGDIIPWVHPTTARDRENYMIRLVRDMERYENESVQYRTTPYQLALCLLLVNTMQCTRRLCNRNHK